MDIFPFFFTNSLAIFFRGEIDLRAAAGFAQARYPNLQHPVFDSPVHDKISHWQHKTDKQPKMPFRLPAQYHEKDGTQNRWCPKMYAASNKSVVDIEKSDGKCLNVIEHLLGKTAGFTHRTAYPLA